MTGWVSEVAAFVEPSERWELEITSVNSSYLDRGELSVELMGRGMGWMDAGTPKGLLKAAEYVEAVQSRQGYYIACIEEIAYRRGFIGAVGLRAFGETMGKTVYGKYLLSVAAEEESLLAGQSLSLHFHCIACPDTEEQDIAFCQARYCR